MPLHADLVLHDARLLEPGDPPGQPGSLALLEGRIVAKGPAAEMEPLIGPGTEQERLGGRTVLPGLIDSHIHLQLYAQVLAQVDCATSDLDTCLERLRAAAGQTAAGEWIRGHGWDQNVWGRWPTAEALDRAAPDHPVYLTAHSLHAAAANSRALHLAGIDATSADPAGGSLQRDAEGKLTGVLLEAAMSLVSDRITETTVETTADSIAAAQQHLWALGVTGAHDYDGAHCLAALQLLRSQGRLGLRVVKNLREHQLEPALDLGLRSGLGDRWLRIGSIKIFTDGALGPRTAAMLKPYDDEPGQRGLLLLEENEIFEISERALLGGFAMTIHAIGDRANRTALAALTRLAAAHSDQKPAFPHRIEHVQLLHPDDVGGLHNLGVVASMQPIHAISDRAMAERGWGRRSQLSYPWRAVEQSGAVLVFGSDAPVEDPNPFWGLHAAVCRCPVGQSPNQAWIPEQRISLRSALRAYTSAPASITGLAGQLGTLEPGASADILVLEQDPFGLPAEEIHHQLPVGTMVGGEWRLRSF